jgi:hypothetical protein
MDKGIDGPGTVNAPSPASTAPVGGSKDQVGGRAPAPSPDFPETPPPPFPF